MPRGSNGKSMLGGTGAQASAVSKYLQQVNENTKAQGTVKTVEDLQSIIGFLNITVANIDTTKKTLIS